MVRFPHTPLTESDPLQASCSLCYLLNSLEELQVPSVPVAVRPLPSYRGMRVIKSVFVVRPHRAGRGRCKARAAAGREQGRGGRSGQDRTAVPGVAPELRAKPAGQGEPEPGQGGNPVIRDHTH